MECEGVIAKNYNGDRVRHQIIKGLISHVKEVGNENPWRVVIRGLICL